MSRKLAIKGHSTRGKEVIKLLEMMGGIGENIQGNVDEQFYYIHEDGYIHTSFGNFPNDNNFCKFTLEEFLEKYPFKVGDKVLIPEYESEVRICKMRWDSLCSYVDYMVYRNDAQEWYTAEELLNYNDNPAQCLDMDYCTNNITKSIDDVYSISKCKTIGQGTYAIKIADGYKFDSIDENGNIIVKSIKPIYPKTYEECCNVMYGRAADTYGKCIIKVNDGYKGSLIQSFQRLIFYRNTYWKIAGNELELGKPWEPDWIDCNQPKFGIHNVQNTICTITLYVLKNMILVFPSEEMRDTFYENFKDLIEQCKELL